MKTLSYPGGRLFGSALAARGDVAGTFSADACCETQVFLYDATTDRVTLPLPGETHARCDIMSGGA